jgi:uncharacterized membrane protein
MMLGMRSWTLSCMEKTAFCVGVVFVFHVSVVLVYRVVVDSQVQMP